MIPQLQHDIQVHSVFGNLRRPQHVLIVLQNQDDEYLLGSKPVFYPPGIYRFVGGGIDKNENPLLAASREFQEELSAFPFPNQLQPLATITTTAHLVPTQEVYTNTTFLYHYRFTNDEQFQASDDIAVLVSFTPAKMRELIARYNQLQADDWFLQDGKRIHSWQDYGKMYGYIHQVALDLTQQN